MGCSPSKINNIETINQCKKRKTFLKQSISACNAFANAHFAYVTALKNTGIALSDYAHDELQSNDDDLSRVPPHPSSYDTLCLTKKDVAWDFFSTLMEDVRLVEVDDNQGSSRIEIPMSRKIQSDQHGVHKESKKRPSPVRSSSNNVENSKLLDVFTELDDGFLKASESAHQVLKILKANDQLHHHSNLANNQGHINHSTRVMRVITWNKSIERPQIANVVKGEFASKGKESLVTLLDKMLAWETKLYDQMKTGEAMKFAYQKKVASLDKLKKRGASTDVLERTKATVSHMHTRYIVDLQFIDSTIAKIIRLRDQQLYPKLVQLVKEIGIMWENMRKQHEHQLKIVQALQNIEISQLAKGSLCECNMINTQLLQFHLKVWCCEFEKLIQHEKIFIKSLMYWLKLNLVSLDNNSSSAKHTQNRKMVTLLCTWQEKLEKLPEEETKTAINKLACMINTMVEYQSEEKRLKNICEETQQEIIKKSRKFEEWCDKKISKRTTHTDELDDIDVMDDMEAIAEQQVVTEALKKRLEAEEKMYRRKCVEVKEKSLINMKNGLQDVFRAMYEFSCACSCMYGSLNSNASF
uniref:protein ROLLING AND ERECT LEAF 2-like n=1 Tax=Erigeron canadensis TaxID=72917 RepID=UPI001CB8F5FE|nr:protein ROLLING AND ERECT LEAF 2-like [Erigeron canadensis]